MSNVINAKTQFQEGDIIPLRGLKMQVTAATESEVVMEVKGLSNALLKRARATQKRSKGRKNTNKQS